MIYAIKDLPENQIRELAALVWMGRKDFDTYESAFDYARTLNLEEAPGYLSDKPLFEYIPAGIEAIENEMLGGEHQDHEEF